jgi:hypothetical protein
MKSALVSDVDRLLAEQSLEWPLLKRGMQGLQDSQTRGEFVTGRTILVRHIPHRIKSTTAAVDAASISRRACFLCAGNLDPEEKGIAFGAELTIYCNPFPILDKHLTIVHAEHRPQQIEGQFGALLRLAESLPGFFVIYNGPQCGASAPDHLHFLIFRRVRARFFQSRRISRESISSSPNTFRGLSSCAAGKRQGWKNSWTHYCRCCSN